MYRALEACTVTMLALYILYFQKFLPLQPDEEAFLNETSTVLREAYQQDIKTDSGSRHKPNGAITKTIEMFKSRDIFQKIKQSKGTANKIHRKLHKAAQDHPPICLRPKTMRPIAEHAEYGITHEVLFCL